MLLEQANLLHQVNGYKLELQIALNKYNIRVHILITSSYKFSEGMWRIDHILLVWLF